MAVRGWHGSHVAMNPLVGLPPGAPAGRLRLLPQRAAFDPDLGLLLVADLHLGKAVTYRTLGVPVPEATTDETLRRLDEALADTEARRVVFLGDLLHSRRSLAPGTLDAFERWCRTHADLALTLVRGNHDDRAGDPPASLGIEVVDGPWRVGGWALVHEPVAVAGAYALGGHLHPGVVVQGRALQRLRLPAFWFGPSVGVLPAFGEFTGLSTRPTQPTGPIQQVYAIADGRVVQVPM